MYFLYNLVIQRAVYRWMLEPADRDAVLINVAIRNGNKDYHVVAEIASVLSTEELLAVRRAYHNRYKRSIEEDVSAHTTGHLRQASHSLLSPNDVYVINNQHKTQSYRIMT